MITRFFRNQENGLSEVSEGCKGTVDSLHFLRNLLQVKQSDNWTRCQVVAEGIFYTSKYTPGDYRHI